VRELGAGAGLEDLDGAVDDGEATDLLRESRVSEAANQLTRVQAMAPTQRT
jgi:hypothetical protein